MNEENKIKYRFHKTTEGIQRAKLSDNLSERLKVLGMRMNAYANSEYSQWSVYKDKELVFRATTIEEVEGFVILQERKMREAE